MTNANGTTHLIFAPSTWDIFDQRTGATLHVVNHEHEAREWSSDMPSTDYAPSDAKWGAPRCSVIKRTWRGRKTYTVSTPRNDTLYRGSDFSTAMSIARNWKG